ncbi:hypothetical protein D4R86_02345 [bacterium]|nr:MAG: hypothetical protein D4R86_02345 [bacterium]
MYNVIRTFGVDYIFFDLIFLAVFLFLLIKFKKKIPLISFFIGGLAINFLIDWGVWLHAGIREVFLPINFFGGTLLFFIWFSLSYGVEYAYVFLMFDKSSKKVKWTLFVFIGWILVALLSQLISINDASIVIVRHMSDLRILRIAIVLIGYSLLLAFKYDFKKILYLFFIGFLVHFMMEFSLLITNIRPNSFLILLENSLIEFNMGVPFFYLIYDKLIKKKLRSIDSELSNFK